LHFKFIFFQKEKKCLKKIKILATLARILLCNPCANLLIFLKKIIFSEKFLNNHRNSPTDFTRNRKLSFPILIFFFLNLLKGSCQDELDHFFKIRESADIPFKFVSKAAFTNARKKLKFQAFIELSHALVRFFQKYFPTKKWKGFTLLAIDASTVKVPKTPEIIEHFGTWKPKKGKPCPVARISQMFDVLNKITVDAIISPKKIGERELAANHFLQLMMGDLILLDRGYPAFWLFALIMSLDAQFCARISYKKWSIVKAFYNSGKKEKIIHLNALYHSRRKCEEMGLSSEPLKLRLIRVELDNGETEVLITSLIDKEKYLHSEFIDLYHERWPVEEDFKTMKLRLEIENFTGKSVHSVYQDFHAKVFTKNLLAVLIHPAQDAVDREKSNRKYRHQINFTQALSKIKDTVVLLFTRPEAMIQRLISKFLEVVRKTTEPIRPGRKYPRNHKIKRKEFYPCYKPVR